MEEVGDAGHQGKQGGEEGDEENKEDGGSPDREQAGLGGCSRVVVPGFQDQMLSLVGGCHKQVRPGTCQCFIAPFHFFALMRMLCQADV